MNGVYNIGLILLHIEKLRLAVQSVLANIYEEKRKTVTAENTSRWVLVSLFAEKLPLCCCNLLKICILSKPLFFMDLAAIPKISKVLLLGDFIGTAESSTIIQIRFVNIHSFFRLFCVGTPSLI